MQRLIYSSLASFALSCDELETLLGSSRKRNEAAGITGILLHVTIPGPDVPAYVQLLEGDAELVDRTYARIRGDELHRDVTLLVKRPSALRTFDGWSMRLEQVPGGVLLDEAAIRDPAAMESLLTTYAA